MCNAQMSGTYTVNRRSNTSTTNFISINAAILSLKSQGINGNVTLNIVSGTGPYEEQVTIPNISGSETYSLEINGHNQELKFGSSTSKSGYVLAFRNAQNIQLKNLIVRSKSYTNTPICIAIQDSCKNILLENNTIISPKDDINEYRFLYTIGISIVDSLYIPENRRMEPAYLTPIPGICENIIVRHNKIENSMFGIVAVYDTSVVRRRNYFEANEIKDFVYIGILVNGGNDIIKGNILTRPSFAGTVLTWPITGIAPYGDYRNQQIQVLENKIFDLTGDTGNAGIWSKSAIRCNSNFPIFYLAQTSYVGNILIKGNKIEIKDLDYYGGIEVSSSENIEIIENEVILKNMRHVYETQTGIISHSTGGDQKIARNKVIINYTGMYPGVNPKIGIQVTSNNYHSEISNNIISIKMPNVTKRGPYRSSLDNVSAWAVRCVGDNSTFDILHNTISYSNCSFDSLYPIAFSLGKGSHAIMNNIVSFKNLAGQGRLIQSQGSNTWTASYNAIHYENSIIFHSDTTANTITSLNAFNQVSQGKNMVENPYFANEGLNDFRPGNNRIMDIAKPLTSVTIDFFGQTRSGLIPDIGAIETRGGNHINIESISVYPNPSSQFFTIGNYQPGVVLRLYNSKGRLIGEFNEPSIDLSGHPKGLYFLRISYDGKDHYKKLILE